MIFICVHLNQRDLTETRTITLKAIVHSIHIKCPEGIAQTESRTQPTNYYSRQLELGLLGIPRNSSKGRRKQR